MGASTQIVRKGDAGNKIFVEPFQCVIFTGYNRRDMEYDFLVRLQVLLRKLFMDEKGVPQPKEDVLPAA